MSSEQRSLINESNKFLSYHHQLEMRDISSYIYSKMYSNIYYSTNTCHKKCDKTHFLANDRSRISSYALNCMNNCINKRQESMSILFKVNNTYLPNIKIVF